MARGWGPGRAGQGQGPGRMSCPPAQQQSEVGGVDCPAPLTPRLAGTLSRKESGDPPGLLARSFSLVSVPGGKLKAELPDCHRWWRGWPGVIAAP